MEGLNKPITEERPRSPYDEETIPSDFIHPSKAEGSSVHIIKSNDIEIPVSFVMDQEGRFRLNGMQEGTEQGAIVSGRLQKELAKINHIVLTERLRKTGISNELIRHLEDKLIERGVETIYAGFYIPETVNFFLKSGYTIISKESLTEEIKKNLLLNPEDFDSKVIDRETFDSLKDTEDGTKKILLMKEISR